MKAYYHFRQPSHRKRWVWALYFALGLGLALLLTSCTEEAPRPRPKGYPRMFLPEHTYQPFACEQCPFTFEYPKYGTLKMLRGDSCVFDIEFPEYGAKWHITQEFLTTRYRYHDALEKYRSMVFHHSQKGRIYQNPLQERDLHVLYFEVYGEVPTSALFFVSDSQRYAVETSFYFQTALRNDSLQPAIDHFKQDLKHMLTTFQWRPSYRPGTQGCP